VEATTHDERNLRDLLVQLEHAKATYLDNPVLLGLLDQRIRSIKAQLGEMERVAAKWRASEAHHA